MNEITLVITEDEHQSGYTARSHWPEGNRDIITEGETREDLIRNIREAIEVSFKAGDSCLCADLHFPGDENDRNL